MKYNGNNSKEYPHVGHVCDPMNPETLPPFVADIKDMTRRTKVALEVTKRYELAGWCEKCSPRRPLIAEEVLAHRLKHAPNSTVRSLVGTVMQHNPDIQRQALELLKEIVQ